MKENEIGGTGSMHKKEENGKHHLGDLSIDGRIILTSNGKEIWCK